MILEAYFLMYPEIKNTETVYCFFDEIQVVPVWEPFVDTIESKERCHILPCVFSAIMTTKSACKTGEVTIQTRILIAVAVIGLCACPFPPPRTLVFFRRRAVERIG